MAKYTELFSEYLDNGGVMPSSSFALIQDFEDLFKERFCSSEIGFETEALFALKLDLKARVVMPIYADRLAIATGQTTDIKNGALKWRFETREFGKTHAENETDGSNTDLPQMATGALPNATSHMEGSADMDAHTDTTDTQEGLTIDERLRVLDEMNRRAYLIVQECLDEFKPLFMGVY